MSDTILEVAQRSYSELIAASSGFVNEQDTYCSVHQFCSEYFANFDSSHPVLITPSTHSFELFNAVAFKFLTSCVRIVRKLVGQSCKVRTQPAFNKVKLGYVISSNWADLTFVQTHGYNFLHTVHPILFLDPNLFLYFHLLVYLDFAIDRVITQNCGSSLVMKFLLEIVSPFDIDHSDQ